MDDPDADFTVANSVCARLSGKFPEKQALHLGGVYGAEVISNEWLLLNQSGRLATYIFRISDASVSSWIH